MKRTKQWWNKLTADERIELHWLEKYNSKWGARGLAGLPDDCTKCENCNTPHLGLGLCPMCSQRLAELISKADHKTYGQKN
jgi:hypothetical protein